MQILMQVLFKILLCWDATWLRDPRKSLPTPNEIDCAAPEARTATERKKR